MTMSSHTPVLAPITGREPIDDLDAPLQAVAQFYRAFNSRDLTLMAENWHDGPDAVIDNPVGGIRRGWPDIRSVYERIFASSARVEVEFWDYTFSQTQEVFWVVGRERGRLTAAAIELDLAIRTSRIFRRVGNRWRQVHHHGSIDDPALLRAYQVAVR
jgi:ketosteroid isomerase-like protein